MSMCVCVRVFACMCLCVHVCPNVSVCMSVCECLWVCVSGFFEPWASCMVEVHSVAKPHHQPCCWFLSKEKPLPSVLPFPHIKDQVLLEVLWCCLALKPPFLSWSFHGRLALLPWWWTAPTWVLSASLPLPASLLPGQNVCQRLSISFHTPVVPSSHLFTDEEWVQERN